MICFIYFFNFIYIFEKNLFSNKNYFLRIKNIIYQNIIYLFKGDDNFVSFNLNVPFSSK